MKKALLFLAAAVAMAAGCTRELDNPALAEEEGQVMVFRATAEDPDTDMDTKVGYTSDRTFFWAWGDEIGILANNSGYPIWTVATYQGKEDMTYGSAIFSTGAYHEQTTFMGVAQYPAALESPVSEDKLDLAKNKFTLGLPWQYNVETTANVFMPLIAKVNDEHASDLYFQHVGGAVKVTFVNIPDCRVKTFHLLCDKKIVGEFALNLSKLGTDNCVAKATATQNEDEKMVEMKLFSTGAKNQQIVYFPVPTGTGMHFGVRVLLDGQEYYYQPLGQTAHTIGRRTILRLPAVDLKNNVGPVFIGEVGYFTIQEAVNAAKVGDVISVPAGTYNEDVTITKGVTIQGDGATTIVRSIAINDAGASVKNVTLKPVSSYGLYINKTGSGKSTIQGVTFDLAEGSLGGIQISGSVNKVTLTGNTFKGAVTTAVFFKDLTESEITFGDGVNDNNTLPEGFIYKANSDVTATEAKNVFLPGASYNSATGEVVVEIPASIAFIGETGYPTIQKAIAAATAGQTVTVLEGTFDEDVTITKAITLKGAGAGTILNSVTITNAAATVKDLTVKPKSTAFGISIAKTGTGVVIENVTFQLASASVSGILVSGSNNKLALKTNTFGGTAKAAVFFSSLTASAITFGNGDADNNVLNDGLIYKADTDVTAASANNTFSPEVLYDDATGEVCVDPAKVASINGKWYASVQKAVNAAAAGQTVTIAEGSFDEAVTISKAITLSGNGSSLKSITVSAGAPTVSSLTVLEGMTISHSGNGVHVDGVSFSTSASSATGLVLGAKGNGNKADLVENCTFETGSNAAITATSAIVTFQMNDIVSDANAAVQISGSGNVITLDNNSFGGNCSVPVLFSNMTASSVTFGNGQADNNTAYANNLYRGSGTSLTATDNTFAPVGYFDEDQNGVFVFGERPTLQPVINPVWQLYSEGAAWNAAFGGTPDSDISIAMDGYCIYLPEAGTSKKMWAISISDKSDVTAVPTSTVKEEGDSYLSFATMVDGVLHVSNAVSVTNLLKPTVYTYSSTGSEPSAVTLNLSSGTPHIGDTFTYQDGYYLMADAATGRGLYVWTADGTSKGRWAFQGTTITGGFTYYPYPGSIYSGIVVTKDGAVYTATSSNSKLNLSALSGTEIAGACAVEYIEYGGKRFVAYALNESATAGYLYVKYGPASDDWASIMANGDFLADPFEIHSTSGNTGSSADNAMDLAVFVDDFEGEVYIACLKQGVGLSLFKISMEMM